MWEFYRVIRLASPKEAVRYRSIYTGLINMWECPEEQKLQVELNKTWDSRAGQHVLCLLCLAIIQLGLGMRFFYKPWYKCIIIVIAESRIHSVACYETRSHWKTAFFSKTTNFMFKQNCYESLSPVNFCISYHGTSGLQLRQVAANRRFFSKKGVWLPKKVAAHSIAGSLKSWLYNKYIPPKYSGYSLESSSLICGEKRENENIIF